MINNFLFDVFVHAVPRGLSMAQLALVAILVGDDLAVCHKARRPSSLRDDVVRLITGLAFGVSSEKFAFVDREFLHKHANSVRPTVLRHATVDIAIG